MELQQESLWENYGFRDNPFDTSPLSLNPQAPLAVQKAFVDRASNCQATRLITNLLRSAGGNRFVLEGAVGVGKTTFINYHKYFWEHKAEKKLFTPIRELSYTPDWSQRYFLLNVLSLLITKILLLKGEKFIQSHNLLREIMLLNKVHNSRSFRVEAEIMGWGAGISQEQQVTLPPVPEAQLFHYFEELVSFILNMGYRGVLLHFDNLELTSKDNLKRARGVFDEIRDALQVRHVYYAFVSQPGFFQQVITPLSRVRSIFFGWPIVLRPLTCEETIRVIHLRYKLLALPEVKFIFPIEDDFIHYLYRIYKGQIRFIMDAINVILMHSSPLLPRTLKTEEARPLLKRIVIQKIEQMASPREWQILQVAAQKDRFTNSFISQKLELLPQNVNTYLQSLVEKGFVRYLKKEGRRAYYEVGEEVRLIGEEKPDREREDESGIEPEVFDFLPSDLPNELNSRQVGFLKRQVEEITLKEYQKLMKVSYSTSSRDLRELEEKGFLRRLKEGRKVIYQLVSPIEV